MGNLITNLPYSEDYHIDYITPKDHLKAYLLRWKILAHDFPEKVTGNGVAVMVTVAKQVSGKVLPKVILFGPSSQHPDFDVFKGIRVVCVYTSFWVHEVNRVANNLV